MSERPVEDLVADLQEMMRRGEADGKVREEQRLRDAHAPIKGFADMAVYLVILAIGLLFMVLFAASVLGLGPRCVERDGYSDPYNTCVQWEDGQ